MLSEARSLPCFHLVFDVATFESSIGSVKLDLEYLNPKCDMEKTIKVETVESYSQKLEDDLKKMGLKIKHHEDNLKFLKSQINSIEESVIDMQVNLGQYYSSSTTGKSSNTSATETEQQTIQNILRQEKTAAGIVCQMKVRHGLQISQVTKDVLGVVAILGKVHDDNLSRLFSEYLGLETMLAIVCKTYEGVKALEKYDKEDMIDTNAGLYGLGPPIGRLLNGRFLVLCLEKLRPFTGEFMPDDPQRKLSLLNPRLPDGRPPPGFVGFAVNMIHLDNIHLSCVARSGHGLRETFDGAISLDGGILRKNGLHYLGSRKHVEVKFPLTHGISNIPANIVEIEEQMKLWNWREERLLEDMKREEALLNHAKNLFRLQSQELMDYLSQSALRQVFCFLNLSIVYNY
uniref:Protein DEFECTIVE IN MERISTEM SILENCING 3 n=1 Tax=Ananas comosus var. bracteatus TaxID=296719 RepID=A0A6V7NVJ4_ANACO|nr:unnamed protein product [Ananas comosus var. bracteatus]